MPAWLIFAFMGVWLAGCVAALWQHFKPGLVFYGLFAVGLVWLTWIAR